MQGTRVLYFIRSPGYLRYHWSVLEALVARGCMVTLLFDPTGSRGRDGKISMPSAGDYPSGVTVGFGVHGLGKRHPFLRIVRNIRSWRRFLFFKHTPIFYKERWVRYLPRRMQALLARSPRLVESLFALPFVGLFLFLVERITLPDRRVRAHLELLKPQVSVFAFRNMPASASDVEYFKAARSFSIPTVVLTSSWDSLTTKGLIPFPPDRLLVWNALQVEEAFIHHGIPRSHTRIVGAYQFDEWFALRKASADRKTFCARWGLDPKKPILFYIGSGAITRDGLTVVQELREALDRAGGDLSEVQIIARPSLDNEQAFAGGAIPRIAVVPKDFSMLSQSESRQLFFDCVSYAAAAVVIHTTGIIDALVKGKQGVVVLRSDYRELQDAEHFTSLLKSGAVEIARSPHEFTELVASILRGEDRTRSAREAFLREQLRPHGLDKPIAGIIAEEIEHMLRVRIGRLSW